MGPGGLVGLVSHLLARPFSCTVPNKELGMDNLFP